MLLVQETKCTDEAWPAAGFAELGYESAHLGTGRWNGVAVLSRVGLDLVTLGLPGQPSFEGVEEPLAIGDVALFPEPAQLLATLGRMVLVLDLRRRGVRCLSWSASNASTSSRR